MVFKTMAENIKSFFRKEEELEKRPQKVPDAAVELFERAPPSGERIVEHKLSPEKKRSQPARKLPFSSEQLRQRLASQGVQRPVASPQHVELQEEDITSQIEAFEQAVGTMDGGADAPAPEAHAAVHAPDEVADFAPGSKGPGYFQQVSSQLKEGDHSVLEGSLDRMKEHHARRSAYEEHVEKAKDMERLLSKRLAELQGLEREWSSKVEEAEAAQGRIEELERTISERTEGLRSLVLEIKTHDENAPALPSPEKPKGPTTLAPAPKTAQPTQPPVSEMSAPPTPETPSNREPTDRSFRLNDGRILSTIADLREALETMDEALYYQHVRPDKNDFAEWVKDVFGEAVLARQLQQARNRFDMVTILS